MSIKPGGNHETIMLDSERSEEETSGGRVNQIHSLNNLCVSLEAVSGEFPDNFRDIAVNWRQIYL
jgi:hypothetical protein